MDLINKHHNIYKMYMFLVKYIKYYKKSCGVIFIIFMHINNKNPN